MDNSQTRKLPVLLALSTLMVVPCTTYAQFGGGSDPYAVFGPSPADTIRQAFGSAPSTAAPSVFGPAPADTIKQAFGSGAAVASPPAFGSDLSPAEAFRRVFGSAQQGGSASMEQLLRELLPQYATQRSRVSQENSDLDVGVVLQQLLPNFADQQSFKGGARVQYGEAGSTRPDWYLPSLSIEVKNYDVETEAGRSNLVRTTAAQAIRRARHLPAGTVQSVVIDVRGQVVDDDSLAELASRLSVRSRGIITEENVTFIRW